MPATGRGTIYRFEATVWGSRTSVVVNFVNINLDNGDGVAWNFTRSPDKWTFIKAGMLYISANISGTSGAIPYIGIGKNLANTVNPSESALTAGWLNRSSNPNVTGLQTIINAVASDRMAVNDWVQIHSANNDPPNTAWNQVKFTFIAD